MKFVAVLRGINVSGQKKIKMTDLKLICESLGLNNVETYIQTGNIIFDSDTGNDLKMSIENAIRAKTKFDVPVEIRSAEEVDEIFKQCPFENIDLVENGTKILVSFLSKKPSSREVTELMKYVMYPEELIIKDKYLYLHCPNGYGKTKLSNAFVEKKLNLVATTRNWKTIIQLHTLSK